MDHFRQQCHQTLQETLRLAAISTTPYSVARVVLLYHQAMYMAVQAFIPCNTCLQHGVSLEQTRHNIVQLDKQRAYYATHIGQFGKSELRALITDSLSQVDLSILCASCLGNLQQQLTATFTAQLEKIHIVYHFRSKKR